MILRFLLVNVAAAIIAVGAWYFGLLTWTAHMPRQTWVILGFVALVLAGGWMFALAGRWNVAHFIAHSLPQFGLLGTFVATQCAADGGGHGMELFHAIIAAAPPTSAGLVGLLLLDQLEFWCRDA